jgi:hypothetical protein
MSNFVTIKDKDGVTLGELPVSSEGGRLRNILYVTSTTNYEKPAWLKFVIVKGVGAGGGGGGTASTSTAQKAASAGGAGGGYFEKRIAASVLSEPETVTIGAPGNGGAAGANNGSTGGSTSFGVHCSATGGAGGAGGAAVADAAIGSVLGGVGGAGTGGDMNLPGSDGGRTLLYNGYLILSGVGGPSFLATTVPHAYDANGLTGSGFGGGGSGISSPASKTTKAGGNGAPGIVIIEEYE